MTRVRTLPLQAPPAPAADAGPRPSPVRAWLYLVWLCVQRQARARQMVWIALVLLAVTVAGVGLTTLGGRWGMDHWRWPRGYGPSFRDWVAVLDSVPRGAPASAVQQAVWGATGALLERTDFFVFSRGIVFSVFLSFLLPLWSLSFATEALGGEREDRTLLWLLQHPVPRPLVYLAKFVGLLPYALALDVGGFGLVCLAAGRPGPLAFQLYWPAVFWSALAFCSLYHLMGALFRRPAVVAIVYSFFLEVILGNMPGTMKRVSVGFYARCMMFESVEPYGLHPEKPTVYLPVDATTALWVLAGMTAACLVIGMAVFARSEYHDLT